MKLKFWGVMGSCPGANPELVEYGIATPCVEIRTAGRIIIFDCGTGIVPFSKELAKEAPTEIDMFLTHTHWDHIQGFPFFSSLYDSRNIINIYAEYREGYNIAEILKGTVANPYFPVSWEQFDAKLSFRELYNNQCIIINDDCLIKTLETYHPDRNLAYRIESHDKSVVYLTDFDHVNLDEQKVIDFIYNADALIYDSHFTDEEHTSPKYKGWGHSTWQKGIEFSKRSNVKNLYLFHHAPHRTKDEMLEIEKQIAQIQANISTEIFIAKEGLILQI